MVYFGDLGLGIVSKTVILFIMGNWLICFTVIQVHFFVFPLFFIKKVEEDHRRLCAGHEGQVNPYGNRMKIEISEDRNFCCKPSRGI